MKGTEERPGDPALDALLGDFRHRRRRALARAISLVEDEAPGFQDLLHRALEGRKSGVRVGLTGPPGAGKSTLVATLARAYRERDLEVGIVAVDPTSPFSGGALLGDRIRMGALTTDPGVFIRSMATRSALGGLATSTREIVDLVDAFGFDRVLLETVGVGQTDLDVTGSVETVVVVLVPESGDAVQAMKAGLMEIADVFVVNKADRPGADRVVRELKQALELRGDRDEGSGWDVPVLRAVATGGEGIDELLEALAGHRTWLEETGELERRIRLRARARIREVVERELRRSVWARPGARALLESGPEGIARGEATPYSIAADILQLPSDRRAKR